MSMTLSLVVKLIEDEIWDNASETVRLLKYRLSSKMRGLLTVSVIKIAVAILPSRWMKTASGERRFGLRGGRAPVQLEF